MPLQWKKSKSSRISRLVSDLQQSPKHGGSLVVETGFPTSLIHLFVKNRDRLKKTSSKRNNKALTSPTQRRVSSPPPPRSLPLKLDPALVAEEDHPPLVSTFEESFVPDNIHDGGRGCCVFMAVVFKVFMVAVLALSTKKLALGITISAFALIFLYLAMTRVFTLLNLCPYAQIRTDSLIEKLIGMRYKAKQEEVEVEKESSTYDIKNKVSFEISEEPKEETRVIVPQPEKTKHVAEEGKKKVQTIRDVVFKNDISKSAKLRSKIVKKIVPKKLRSYNKKKIKETEQEDEVEEEEEEGSVTEVSSLDSSEESAKSERDDAGSNPSLLESCTEIEEEEEIESKRDLRKVIGLIVIVLVGLLNGKVFAIGLTLSSCLIPRVLCYKSQTSL